MAHQRRILVVDDDLDALYYVDDVLSELGYYPIKATTADDAAEIVGAMYLDAVIMNFAMVPTASEAALEQLNGDNIALVVHSDRRATIKDSVISNSGITAANQATGNMANQANAIAVAVSPEFGVALSEADLGQWQLFNQVDESHDIDSTATMVGSVFGNSGVTAVNQSSGHVANQANVLSISVAGTL